MDENVIVSPMKNPRGKIVSSDVRKIIIYRYKSKLKDDPNIKIRACTVIISKELGIGQRTISNTIAEYNKSKMIISPNRNRTRLSYKDTFDEYQKNSVRQHVHSFWLHKTLPTLDKIFTAVTNDNSLPTISRTNLYSLLKSMNFEYAKRGSNSGFIEKDEIVLWRRQYLKDLRKYREEGRLLYYLGGTLINPVESITLTSITKNIKSNHDVFLRDLTSDSKNPTDKEEILVVLHIGSVDGFLPGGLLCIESKYSKKKIANYHGGINKNIYFDWMASILPQLKENSVIIMENASYNSVKLDETPTTATERDDIIKWLEDKGEKIDRPMVIPELIEIVNKIKPLKDIYVMDELAKLYNKTILRLPPYHRELNAIEHAWSLIKNHVKINNITYKVPNVKELIIEGIEQVNKKLWEKFTHLAVKEEEKFWDIDFIVDNLLAEEETCRNND